MLTFHSIAGVVKYCRDKDRCDAAMERITGCVNLRAPCSWYQPYTQPELIPYSHISTTSKQVKTPLFKYHWNMSLQLLVSMQIYRFVVHCVFRSRVFCFKFSFALLTSNALRIRRPTVLILKLFLDSVSILYYCDCNTDWFLLH